ncbi:MAG: hypothetical protein GOMPHAMPRED_001653 [Gomphillus americanus]|uniref:Uncharacterized protein n=1 Tax=Gomphillus americanus TaxID=1940652 RepID=A0A8H3FAB5_9LECA|nr:MAG: hypothetical protein GOMPHAMPRED_001653 [Gomphillus americanus]
MAVATIDSVYPEDDLFVTKTDEASANLKKKQKTKKKRIVTPLIKQEEFDKSLKQDDSPALSVDPLEVHGVWKTDDEPSFDIADFSEDELQDELDAGVHYLDIGVSSASKVSYGSYEIEGD